MKRVVLISGGQGSGKSTLAEALQQRLGHLGHMVRVFKFADPIYEMHAACLPILKRLKLVDKTVTKEGALLQVLGTEYGRRHLGEDVWVRTTKRAVEDYLDDTFGSRTVDTLETRSQRVAIIDDLRFPNEFDAFPWGIRIRLEADEAIRKARCSAWRSNTRHPSEVALDQYVREGKFGEWLWRTDLPDDKANLLNQRVTRVLEVLRIQNIVKGTR